MRADRRRARGRICLAGSELRTPTMGERRAPNMLWAEVRTATHGLREPARTRRGSDMAPRPALLRPSGGAMRTEPATAERAAAEQSSPRPRGGFGQERRMGNFEAGEEGLKLVGARQAAGACPVPDPAAQWVEGGEASPGDEGVTRLARPTDWTRERLAKEYGLTAAFVGVAKLAAVLGIAPSTIYGHMRAGRFFLPYRMLNASPMVRVDDLADWLGSPDGVVAPGEARLGRRRAGRPSEEGESSAKHGESDARVDKIVAAALRSMGMEPEVSRKAKAKSPRKLGPRVKPK